MNILMINYEYPPVGGGGSVFNKLLAEELSATNNITVITSGFHGQSAYEIANNVEIYRVPVFMRNDRNAATLISMISFFPASLLAGYKLLRKKKFDAVHSMFAIPSAPSGLALAKKFNIPHILSILGGDIYDPTKKLSPHKTPFLRYVVRKMIDESDKVVALSSDIMERAYSYYDIAKKIDIVHLGIQSPDFNKCSRETFGLSPDDTLLVTVGRLVQRKGVEDLVNVIAALENGAVKLIVIGDGPEKEKLVALSNSLGISDRILFYGNVSDEKKTQLLNISDIYVSSSRHEGFGLVFLEAMDASLPVVTYDKGGQVDFLLDNKTGFLVKAGDKGRLTECIDALSKDITLREKMSEYNKDYVKKFYMDACAMNYNNVYESVIHEYRSRN